MRIERLDPGREVRWLCTAARMMAEKLTRKNERVGTEIVFRLSPQGVADPRLDFGRIVSWPPWSVTICAQAAGSIVSAAFDNSSRPTAARPARLPNLPRTDTRSRWNHG